MVAVVKPWEETWQVGEGTEQRHTVDLRRPGRLPYEIAEFNQRSDSWAEDRARLAAAAPDLYRACMAKVRAEHPYEAVDDSDFLAWRAKHDCACSQMVAALIKARSE